MLAESPAPEDTASTQQGLQAETTISFSFDWQTRQSSALVKGNRLRIEYAASRIQCFE